MKTITNVSHRILITVFVLFCGIHPSGDAQAGDLEDLRQKGVIRHLGIPYANFVTGSGDGLDVDIIKLFAAHLGVTYEHVPTDWTSVIGDLSGLQVRAKGEDVEIIGKTEVRGDVIANGLTKIPWREKVVAFSLPTFPNQVWLVARADAPVQPIVPSGDLDADIATVKQLVSGKTVLHMPNTCLDAALYNLSAVGAVPVDFSGSLNDLAPALIDGKAELLLLDVADSLVALEKWPQQIKILGPLSEPQVMGVAFSKSSPELLDEFDRFFEIIRKDGSYRRMVKRYYPQVLVYFAEFFN